MVKEKLFGNTFFLKRKLIFQDFLRKERTYRQTGFLLTLEEGQVVCGVGAELAFRVRERFPETRVARVGARPIPVASSPALESYAIPDSARVIEAVHVLLGDAVPRKAL